LFVADAREKSRIIDFVAVQVKDRQNCAIPNGTQELVDVPRSCQWSCFRFSVSDNGRDNQLGVVERSAAGVRKNVSQLASLVDRAGSLRRAVTTEATWERKLLEECVGPPFVLAFFRIDLGVGPLEVSRTQNARSPSARTGHENHVQGELLDHSIEVNIGEREPRTGTPMAEKPVFNVLGLQRLLQQRISLQVNHAEREVL